MHVKLCLVLFLSIAYFLHKLILFQGWWIRHHSLYSMPQGNHHWQRCTWSFEMWHCCQYYSRGKNIFACCIFSWCFTNRETYTVDRKTHTVVSFNVLFYTSELGRIPKHATDTFSYQKQITLHLQMPDFLPHLTSLVGNVVQIQRVTKTCCACAQAMGMH